MKSEDLHHRSGKSAAKSCGVSSKGESFLFWRQFVCHFDPTAVSSKIPRAVLIVCTGPLCCHQPAGEWSPGDFVVTVWTQLCMCTWSQVRYEKVSKGRAGASSASGVCFVKKRSGADVFISHAEKTAAGSSESTLCITSLTLTAGLEEKTTFLNRARTPLPLLCPVWKKKSCISPGSPLISTLMWPAYPCHYILASLSRSLLEGLFSTLTSFWSQEKVVFMISC